MGSGEVADDAKVETHAASASVERERADAAETIGAALDLDEVLADRVPSDKVDAVAIEQRLNPTLIVGEP